MKPSEFLTDESKWIKGALAKDKNGNYCDVLHSHGECYCLLGLLFKFYRGSDFFNKEQNLRNIITDKTGIGSITRFNDHPNTIFQDIKEVLIQAGL